MRHWGYSFTEPFWVSVLEVLSSLPSEVIFSCGCQMGLLELLAEYVKIVAIQREIKSFENTSKIRPKLVNLLGLFEASEPSQWREWMDGKIEGIEKGGPVKDLARKCNFELPEGSPSAKAV